MSQEEARLLLDAWNYFDSHPKEKFWEGLPGISRNEFYRLMPVITGIENLVEAKIYLGRFAQGEISQTVPGTIIEKAREGDVPKPYIEDAKRATLSVRAWIKNIKPKTAEALAEREVAAAQVKAELARIEEVRVERPKMKVTPSKAPAPIPKTPVPSPPSEEPVLLGIKTTPARVGAFQKFTARVATLPVRAAIEWSRPTLAASEPQRVAALTLWARGIPSEKLEEKAVVLERKEKARLIELVKAIKNEEQSSPDQTQRLKLIFPIKDINFLLGPESGLTQTQVSTFFAPGQQGGIFVIPRRSFLKNIFIRAGQQLFGKASSKFLKKATAKAAAKVAAGVAAKLGVRAAAVAIGAPGGPLGVVAGFLASFVPDALSWLKRNFRKVAMAFGALVFGVGFVLQSGVLMVGGAAMGFGGLVAQAGGVGPALSTAAGVSSSVISGITSLAITSIATPLIVALISIPVLVAIILFIINSGAYLVPPKVPAFTGILESPYIAVEKNATPDCLNRTGCPGLPGEVTYTIEIKAKKGTLTNVRIENSYQIFGKGTGTITPPKIEAPKIISPTSPFSFSYKLKFEKNLDNSVVYDTLTVIADAPEQKDATASDVASVIIGNPPASSCPVLGGVITTGSYNGTSEIGHGSNPYWSGPAGTDCGYDIPAFSGCNSPTSSVDPDGNNVCKGIARACSYYGFAADVHRSGAGDVVQLPSIFGKSINWTFQRRVTIADTAWGWGYIFTGSDGGSSYSLYLGHLNQTTPPQTAPSGSVVGTLYPNITPPHVHIELQINGQWVRPDFLCGGPGP
ncbi:MAG: hypothetical protein AAB875_03640 [Patescibacteria group bacterium]